MYPFVNELSKNITYTINWTNETQSIQHTKTKKIKYINYWDKYYFSNNNKSTSFSKTNIFSPTNPEHEKLTIWGKFVIAWWEAIPILSNYPKSINPNTNNMDRIFFTYTTNHLKQTTIREEESKNNWAQKRNMDRKFY